MKDDIVLFHDKDKVRVGGVFRYDIYLESSLPHTPLYLRVRNTELAALRAAYLNGPFTLYVDVMPMDYDECKKTPKGAEPNYENHLKAGSHFSSQLNVRLPKQRWRVTVSSEILFSRNVEVNFEITIGTTREAAKIHGAKVEQFTGADPSAIEFKVNKYDTSAIWQQPIPAPDKPLHICVLTHGLVSNVTADMLYLKEALDETARQTGENLICKGYTGNVCRTERGVKYLGKRLANWLANELIPTYNPKKLSFIAHSLGGLIQTYALGFLNATNPQVLEGIELVNFVALASPFLGISHENPGYVQFALSFGVAGKTGRDLGLAWAPGTSKPLLERLPGKKTMEILQRFEHRTIYANAVHDGIVPLRTASLLYLDWRALGRAKEAVADEKRYRRSSRHLHPNDDNNNHDNKTKSDGTANASDQNRDRRNSSDTTPKPLKKMTTIDNQFSTFLFGENRVEKVLTRYQTVSSAQDLDLVGESLPKKTSLIESGLSLLLPPHPDNHFITDPECRDDVIFHDRVYYEKDLPERRYKSKLIFTKGAKEKVDVSKSEERIARSYHSGTSWRKVLVELLPEAHNNIIVRRRFSNAYGWPVVRHLTREHFYYYQEQKEPRPEEGSEAEVTAGTESLATASSAGASADSVQLQTEGSAWSESEDEHETEPEKDLDPHRTSMFRIIPKVEE